MWRSARTPVLAAAALLAGLTLGGPTAFAEGASHVVTGRVSAGEVATGTRVAFGGAGFAPHALVRLSDEGTALGTTQADASGAFRTTVTVSGRPGYRTLAGTGPESGGAVRIATVTVRVVDGTVAGQAGSSEPTALALLAGFGIVVLGAGARFIRRRQRAAGAPAWL